MVEGADQQTCPLGNDLKKKSRHVKVANLKRKKFLQLLNEDHSLIDSCDDCSDEDDSMVKDRIVKRGEKAQKTEE
jgi:hypothetical protein